MIRRILSLLLLVILFSTPLTAQGLMPPVLTSGAVSLTAQTTSCTVSDTTCAVLTLSGLSHVYVQISGTFSGTVQFESTIDKTNWVAANMTPLGSTTPATSASSTGVWAGTGVVQFRVRCSTFSSGTIVVTVYAKSN